MSFPVLASLRTVQAVVHGLVRASDGSNRRVLNGFIYGQLSGMTPLNKSAFALAFATQVWDFISLALGAAYQGVSLTVKDLGDAGDEPESQLIPANGQVPGPRLPLELAVFCRLRTLLRGSHYQGAKFFTPIPSSFVQGDELNATGTTAWNTAAEHMQATLGDADGRVWQPAVVSRDLSQLDHNPTSIIGAYVSQVAARIPVSSWRHRREQVQRPYSLRSRGGLLLDGSSTFLVRGGFQSRGGLLFDGSSTFLVLAPLRSSGGLLFDGIEY